MEVKYSSEIPEKVTRTGVKRTLSYNVREMSEEELRALWDIEPQDGTPYEYWAKEHRYVYNVVTMGSARWSYSDVVEAIIRDRYTIDEMEAMTNNMAAINAVFMQTLVSDGIIAATKYLKDSIDDVNTQNFKAMQEWRAMAKREAKEVFG